MNIASKIGTDKVSIYSQDISQKSSNLLRLNLILNNLSHSINNIVQGNTITENKHTEKMDYVVSNPPFKLDFSDWQPQVSSLPNYTERFFAGVPNIPRSAKDKMAIYLLFIQHILWSLNDKGKAAVVVPTGFITAQSGIEKKIREKLVENHWLKGVVSMPSNIFATTGTNVSVVFMDKSGSNEERANRKPVLVDASKLGEKRTDDGNQRTYLSAEEEAQIVSAFTATEPIDDFSVMPSWDEIREKNCSFAAGQYFDITIDYVDITGEEFDAKIADTREELREIQAESERLNALILESLGKLKVSESLERRSDE